jgi:NAD(P)H-nitrite reductase large subunit
VICACVDAGARQIIAAIEGQSLADGAAVGRTLQAGTNRGSRRPRLQALLGARQPERVS